MVVHKPVGLSVLDLRGQVVDSDDTVLEMLSCDRSDIVGRDALWATYKPDIAMSAPVLQRLLHTGQGFTILKRSVRSDGEVIWVQSTVGMVKHLQGTPFISSAAFRADRPRFDEQLADHYAQAKRLCAFLIAGRAAFGADTFWAPPVEILLYLYREETEARGVVVDELARAINVPTSTTLRWVRLLHQQKLIEVEHGGEVTANAFVRVGAAAEQKLDGLLARLSQGL